MTEIETTDVELKIHKELYDDVKKLAEDKGVSVTKVLEDFAVFLKTVSEEDNSKSDC